MRFLKTYAIIVTCLFIGLAFLPRAFEMEKVVASGYDKKHQPAIVDHVTSQATTVQRRIRWNGGTAEIWIQNRDATNNLLVSFDTGDTKKWWTIPANTNMIDVYPISVNQLWLKSSASTVNFEMLIFKRSRN